MGSPLRRACVVIQDGLELLSAQKDLAICQLLAGWDSLEKRLGGSAVIDFNLPDFSDPGSATRYTSRLEVLNDLKAIQQDAEVNGYPRLLKKLRAQEVYLRNVMGEHWEFSAYIENTMGFTPALFSEEQLCAQRKRIEERLEPWGIRVDEDLGKNFLKVQEIIPPDDVGAFYQTVFDRGSAALASIIGPPPEFNFEVQFDDVDAYW